jgi:hypothetical protein
MSGTLQEGGGWGGSGAKPVPEPGLNDGGGGGATSFLPGFTRNAGVSWSHGTGGAKPGAGGTGGYWEGSGPGTLNGFACNPLHTSIISGTLSSSPGQTGEDGVTAAGPGHGKNGDGTEGGALSRKPNGGGSAGSLATPGYGRRPRATVRLLAAGGRSGE